MGVSNLETAAVISHIINASPNSVALSRNYSSNLCFVELIFAVLFSFYKLRLLDREIRIVRVLDIDCFIHIIR